MRSKLAKFTSKQNSGIPAISATAAISQGGDLHGYTLAELEEAAHPDEWQEVKGNTEVIEAFALSLREGQQASEGTPPERWTGEATCRRCGTISVPPFMAGQTISSCRFCSPEKRVLAGRARSAGIKRAI